MRDFFLRIGVDPEWALPYLGRFLGALLILAVGWLASRYLVGPLRRLLERTRLDPSVGSFLANTSRTVLLVIIIIAVLQQIGVEAASMLTLLGTIGLAVALSLQGSLANFASGLLVLSFRMVRVGDLIEVGELRGRVAEMLPFHVILVTTDNQRITVPNTLLTSGPIRNNSALPVRRVLWTLPLRPQENLDAARELILARLHADARILPDPAPQVYVQDWTDDKRVLANTAWTATGKYPAVQQELLEVLGRGVETLRRPVG